MLVPQVLLVRSGDDAVDCMLGFLFGLRMLCSHVGWSSVVFPFGGGVIQLCLCSAWGECDVLVVCFACPACSVDCRGLSVEVHHGSSCGVRDGAQIDRG